MSKLDLQRQIRVALTPTTRKEQRQVMSEKDDEHTLLKKFAQSSRLTAKTNAKTVDDLKKTARNRLPSRHKIATVWQSVHRLDIESANLPHASASDYKDFPIVNSIN